MLSIAIRDEIAWLTLDRAEKLNAMNRGFWSELRARLDQVRADPSVRVAVFHGAGSCFSVGGDFQSFGELHDTAQRRDYIDDALSALRAVEQLPKPTIAAVHGHVLGGGCELTMVCDIVIADETARFGTPEAAVGLMPGLAVVRGQAHAGLHWLKYMALTGESIDADTARLAGLVNVVVGTGGHLDEAERLARLIARRAPVALAVAKRILGRHSDDGYAHAIEAISLLQGTDDFAEGMAAFADRREPRFRGR